jgi:hypothetical protein
MRAYVIATLAILATAFLAGCNSPSEDAATDSGPTFDDLGLQATSSTGLIRGVVVDEAVRPIPGARVKLQGDQPMEAVTTDLGTFGFDDLEPGTYFMTIGKPGYFDAQQSADVVAGVAEPPIVKVQLAMDVANQPYYENYVFEGFIECSGTFVAVGYAVCSGPNIVSELTGTDNVTQDDFGVRYALSKKPTWLQSEMVWQSTQALGDKMSVMYSWECDTNDGFLCDHGVAGTSPLLLTADAEAIEEINHGDYDQEIFVRVFNEGLDETQVGVGGGLGVTLQQRFTVFTHAFYGYEPTEGWRFSSGEPVPQPEA